MGSMHATEYANAVDEGLDLSLAIRLHLTSNHYPPIPVEMVSVAMEAIEHANQGEWNEIIALPGDITWKGEVGAPVSAIVEDLHLDFFLDPPDEF